MNITFISFASNSWKNSFTRIKSQIDGLEIFSNIVLFDEHMLKNKTNFYEENKTIFNVFPKAYGGGIWKPYIIEKCFEIYPETDLFFYSDSGNEFFFNAENKNRFNQYTEKAIRDSFLAFRGPVLENKYSHCSVINEIYPNAKDTKQFNSGTLFIKNNKVGKKIIEDWKYFCIKDNYRLILCEEKCCDDFYTNIYDQSILSCILKKYNIEGIQDECDWFLSPPMSKEKNIKKIQGYPIFNARNPYKYSIIDKCLKYHDGVKCVHFDNDKYCEDTVILR